MPKSRPATSGYAQIAQAEEEEEDSGLYHDEDPFADPGSISASNSRYAPIQPRKQRGMDANAPQSPGVRSKRHHGPRPRRSNSGVDIKAINQRLERWAEEIASKFRRRRKTEGDEEQPEILHSVFQAPDWVKPATAEDLAAYDASSNAKTLKIEYDDIVETVRVAIELGVHPKLISKGSSGSYFACNGDGKTVGVFKPKDEEPYASKNPKWTKWIHRNLFPFAFGRVCLIPNLSYVSEAAAYVLDTQLRTNIVPPTEVVAFSSKSFHYDFWDRRAYYRKRKPLPEKLGSLQIFLKGYKDATEFLREHPWPDRHNNSFKDTEHRKKKRRWTDTCRPGGAIDDDDDDDDIASRPQSSAASRDRGDTFWTEQLQQSMREQLEKLVILDYIMRNTDRGLDNWMIKIDQGTQEAKIVVEPPGPYKDRQADQSAAVTGDMGQANGYTREEPMSTTSRSTSPTVVAEASVSLGAIDNSLSWPWKHPDAWRSYPFGWLFLPVSLIGQPFSESTRQHFLPLLTSKNWWMETQLALRRCFMQDADFQEKMFARQMAVMKGQAWNVVETLKTPDHGPLELTRRTRVCVWDDVQEVPVAVPMGRPSRELREESRREGGPSVSFNETEEMDISAARQRPSTPPKQSQSLPQQDLLGSPTLEANRFNTSRQNSSSNIKDDAANTGTLSPGSMQQVSWSASTNDVPKAFAARSSRPDYKSRMSYDEPRKIRQPLSPEARRRRFSLNIRRPSNPLSAAFGFGGDDDEDDDGDLGYSAAEDREGNRKKVIVERLETVKSRKPFFEWC